MKKRGISLIVLIVTIIVIIILAAVVILTLSKNNPIESAKEARFKEDVRTFQDELAMTVSKQYAQAGGHRDTKISTSNFNQIKEIIPSFSEKYKEMFVIKNDELKYQETIIGKELEWCKSLNLKLNVKTGAEIIKENPKNYYGKKIKYTAPNGINDWKIFYSDGSNIYIISSEYVNPVIGTSDLSTLPSKNGVNPVLGETSKAAKFGDLINQYDSGSTGITDKRMKEFNSDYYKKEYTSGNNANMKAVAYMLDFDIWSKLYVDATMAEYAVGGPSIEMVLKSYSEKCSENFIAQAMSSRGYQISKDGGINWANGYNFLFKYSEKLYVIPSNSGATAMWLSSPSHYTNEFMMNVHDNGNVRCNNYTATSIGFRPLVCLKSNILINWIEDENIYEIKK